MNQWLGRGINLGNALDAGGGGPVLGLEDRYFDAVVQAGFDTVRLPVRWAAHADSAAPYTIDPAFFERVDAGVRAALERDLNVVVDVHHYHDFCVAPDQHLPRFLAIWEQIGTRYADCGERLCFELLNEPRGRLTANRWNTVAAQALAVVRDSNPGRTVIIGSAEMNDPGALSALAVPDDDHLIATVHYYAPFEFTHQGARWVEGAEQWLGRTWGTPADESAVRAELAGVAAWGRRQRLPLFIGEFGAFFRADMRSRARWTAFVRTEAELLGMSWAYWDFGTDFGAYDPDRRTWREPLLRALGGHAQSA